MIKSSEYFGDIYNKYPVFPDVPEGLTSFEALNNLSKSMLFEKMNGNIPLEYRNRMNEELAVIKKMGFCDYLLIVYDFINMARKEDIYAGPGRGSAAGSLVAYALGITQIDPIKYDLLFSRWLNEGRAATPLILSKEMRDLITKEAGN
jgi:DNA polymerase-3 subunit alpha